MIYKQIQEWNKQEGATQIFQPSRNYTEVFALNKPFINSSTDYSTDSQYEPPKCQQLGSNFFKWMFSEDVNCKMDVSTAHQTVRKKDQIFKNLKKHHNKPKPYFVCINE